MRRFGSAGGLNPGTGFAAGVDSGVNNFLGVMNMANNAKYADLAEKRQALDARRQENEESYVTGQRGAQENVMGGLRGVAPGAGALYSGHGTAQPLGTATPDMAQASPMGGGPLQQAEEYKINPNVTQAYKRAGEASVHRDKFQAQVKGELGQYKQIESGLAKTLFDAKNLQQAHREAVAMYGPGTPEALKVEADIQRANSDQQYYKNQLNDFRQTVLGLASSTNPETGEITIDDQGLYDALSQWLDKGSTVGQRAGIEQGLSSKPRMPGGMGHSSRRPSAPRPYRQSLEGVGAATLASRSL